jgi:small subunit ribosomal protein S6
MLVRYETLILASPEITGDETRSLEEHVERILKKNEGVSRSFERWGKYRLAYPVRNNEYGIYFLTRFEVDSKKAAEVAQELHALFTLKLPQIIMRFMTNKLDLEGSLTYHKPDSLEDLPTQDVDSFLRENHMNSFIKSEKSHDGRRFSRAPRQAAVEASAPSFDTNLSSDESVE